MGATPGPGNERAGLRLALRPWLTSQFSREYWTFFSAGLCMDLGFGLFVFLFNLYLIDLHFDERLIGRILAFYTLGNVAGTIPAMIVARRYGLRPLLLPAFSVVPVLAALRLFFLRDAEQFALAFLTGAALCGWPICFSPVIAQLTNEHNRPAGFSVAFATGIGVGTLAGFAGGLVPELLHTRIFHLTLVHGIRVLLLTGCGLVVLGLWPLRQLPLQRRPFAPGVRSRIFHPYLLRFLPGFMLWNVVTGSFPLFGAVYLQKMLGLPLGKLGAVFGAAKLMQVLAVLAAPFLFRRTGIAAGVALTQLATAALLVAIGETRFVPAAVCFYVLYFAAQFMCEPGIYQMLMEQLPQADRSSASAIQNLSGATCQAGTAAITGAGIVVYGYHLLLLANAAIAVVASLFFAWLGLRLGKFSSRQGAGKCPTTSSSMAPQDAEWMLERTAE
jgi:MFS family permease